MKKQTATKTIVVGCLLIGVLAGAAAAQVVDAIFQVQYMNTGLFTMTRGQNAAFHVSLDDRRDGLPARVALAVFDSAGAVVARQDAVLRAGESTTMRIAGPGVFRAHAQIADSSIWDLAARRRVVGSVEVIDGLTAIVRPICSFDPEGLPPGR